ncbi:hypothetical protein SAMN05428989_0726 [Pseudoxanthomonas sp. GM95]|uniref:hypothetical protein n=1 Tax=Pseudoxanthomonas sp. GM95 TaxID=1881043 RepID=UPI0008BC31FD|nr:hypothetical protein [Pseudoxanthomonas sp. GM95]SEK74913.1 hypothetical protein SAMN05428989_0726 [Pseudoxanthomonas sp. GM95]
MRPRRFLIASVLYGALAMSFPGHADIRLVQVWAGQESQPLLSQSSPLQLHYTLQPGLGDGVRLMTIEQDPARPRDTLRVRIQHQTSLAISGEGPHLDLIDWKHCTSSWQTIADPGDGRFQIPEPTPEQAECFPAFSKAELLAAVRAQEGSNPSWERIAEGVPRAGEGASYVAPSLLRMKLERWDGLRWVEVTQFDVSIEMGC